MNKSRLLKLLRVKPEEKKIVFFTFLFAFFIGAAQNILFSVPLAMFLARFSSSFLPHIYIATGISTFFVGMAFAYLEKTVSVFYVLALPIALFSTSLFFFWGLLFVIKTPWIFIVLLVWSLLIVSLIISIVMLLINQLFTFQQSKRLYGLIFVGISIGGIIIGLGMDFLVKSIGSNNLILLSALILLCGFLTQFWIRKHSGNRLLHVEEMGEAKAAKVSLKSFKDKNYILYVFLLTTCVYFIFYTFDLLLNTAVKLHFPTETEMAVFYGILFAVYDVAALVAGFILTGWVLSRFGLIISLLILPVGLAILLTLAFFVDLIPSFAEILFGFILVAAVFEATIRECIADQSTLLLFQPLRPIQRAWAQIKNETIITPLATAVIGAILLMIEKFFSLKLSILSIVIVILSLAAVAIIFFKLKNGYLRLLEDSLSKRSITNPRFTKLGKDSLSVLKGRLKSNYPEEVIYVLQTIENIDRNDFVKTVLESLDNPLEEVRSFCLRKIEQYRIKAGEEKVKQICLTEKDPAVLGAALLALGAIADLDQIPWFRNYLLHSNIEIASSSIVALIKYGSEIEKKEAIELLDEKTLSFLEEDRLTVANALRQIDIPIKTDLLLILLKDPSLEVRIIAADAASNKANEKLYPALIENLEIPHVHDAAFIRLISFGRPLLSYVIDKFDNYSHNLKLKIINVLGFIKDGRVSDFLEKLMSISNRSSLHAVLLALKRHSYKPADDEKHEVINNLLESENKNILYLKDMASFFNTERTRLLHDLLCREIELSQECCFSLLSFIYPEISIMRAEHGLALEDVDTHSNAVELLLHTLEKKDQNLLMEQLVYAPYQQEEIEESLSEEKAEEFLLKIKDYASNCFIPALSAAVIYEIGVLKIKNLAGLLIKQELRNDPLMKESVQMSLKKLEMG